MTAQDYKAPESVGRLQQRALFVGLIGLVLCVIGYVKSPENFLHSYLLAFIFVLGLSLGSLGLLMLQHLTGGHWGIVHPASAGIRHSLAPACLRSVFPDLFRHEVSVFRVAQCSGLR